MLSVTPINMKQQNPPSFKRAFYKGAAKELKPLFELSKNFRALSKTFDVVVEHSKNLNYSTLIFSRCREGEGILGKALRTIWPDRQHRVIVFNPFIDLERIGVGEVLSAVRPPNIKPLRSEDIGCVQRSVEPAFLNLFAKP